MNNNTEMHKNGKKLQGLGWLMFIQGMIATMGLNLAVWGHEYHKMSAIWIFSGLAGVGATLSAIGMAAFFKQYAENNDKRFLDLQHERNDQWLEIMTMRRDKQIADKNRDELLNRDKTR